jgi:hypothetical protein
MAIALPELPPRIARLAKDSRGYPVPAFIQWMKDGEPADKDAPGAQPDFRIARSEFRARAFKQGLCWICGELMGVHRVYVIGPMCVVNRTTSEPASHRACAEFAAEACPFLVRPRMKRLPENGVEHASPGGLMIERNPGCVALYETREAKAFKAEGGWLIKLGKPDRIDWVAEGRRATRAEIEASIDSGYPILMAQAVRDGQDACLELGRLAAEAAKLLPAA